MAWDREADVVVVGLGAAGATAALLAYDAGSRVLVLEKTAMEGGNTAASAGTILCPENSQEAVEHILTLSHGSVGREMVETYVREASRNVEWLRSLGAEVELRGGASFPQIPGASTMKTYRVTGPGTGGEELWRFLRRTVEGRGIEVLTSTRVKEILQDEEGEVLGVAAEANHRGLRIRARRGVVLTCGGFEYDEELKRTFLPGPTFYSFGCPANTGDGVRMAQKAGAALWHMQAVAAPLGHKFPEFEAAFGANLARQSLSEPFSYAFIYVDKHGRRFMNELGVDNHLVWSDVVFFDAKHLEHPRVPCYIIFDETARRKGAVGRSQVGYNRTAYAWSPDNSVEIAKGWIAVGATVAELAQNIGADPENLSHSITEHNRGYELHSDMDGRPPRTLLPLNHPPFYAIRTFPCLLNTQGGPVRDSRALVLDPFGAPIRRLYSAGELGSLWGFLYQSAGNLGECLAFGRIAGRNAAAETPSDT